MSMPAVASQADGFGLTSSAGLQRPIPVALVGANRLARECYGPGILQNPNFHLRAVWSRTEATANSFNLEVAGCSLEAFYGDEGFERLLSNERIEAYVVALPVDVRPRFLARIWQRGRHVFCASPIAADRKGAEELLQKLASGPGGPVWFVSDPLLHEPVFQPSTFRLADLGPVVAAELSAVVVDEVAVAAAATADGDSACADKSVSRDERRFVALATQHVALVRQLLGRISEVNFTLASEYVRRYAGALRVGTSVKVVREIASNSAVPLRLPAGLSGSILEIDGAGDALIDFEGQIGPQWVVRSSFGHLQVLETAGNGGGSGGGSAAAASGSGGVEVLCGTFRLDSGAVCAVNWQTCMQPADERFRLTLWGARGSQSVELETASSSSASGLRCYALRRSVAEPGEPLSEATCFREGDLSYVPAAGAERQLEAFGAAIRAASRPQGAAKDRARHSAADADGSGLCGHTSALRAIVDLMVLSATLQSRGTPVRIRETSKADW
eukprot:TRINITY_DN54243_c0_g1_i2.p1 TRINITY_DN54243_c0_g1~~TRINITY_DN54243_c0_g1_i2.p1  ORF type:complete len:501 (+),score=116.31 TRINITY_DN54243_c0_g1_i2:81-1583(+)